MFKKGQLVKCTNGRHGIVELKSDLFPGEYIVIVQNVGGVNSVIRTPEEDLKLIGNNFKFKGAK
ncbi:hypothetical protein NEP52_21390 [Escherichia coli]|nr:hypothetical protein [Escherichia coli]